MRFLKTKVGVRLAELPSNYPEGRNAHSISSHDVAKLAEGRRDPLGWDSPLRFLVRANEELPAFVVHDGGGKG